MLGRNYGVNGALTNTASVMNGTFLIGSEPSLPQSILEFSDRKIKTLLSKNL